MAVATPRMSKPFFLGSYFGMLALLLLIAVAGVYAINLSQSGDEQSSGLILGIAALICIAVFIYDIIVYCPLVFKCGPPSRTAMPGQRRGKAVGLLFIPFYGLVLDVRRLPGLCSRIAQCPVERRQLKLPPPVNGIVHGVCGDHLATVIPYLGCITILPLLIVYPILIAKTCIP